MAYDANDPADKKIVDRLIADAVAVAVEEAATEHDAAIEGLKNKNKELLGKITKLRAGGDAGDTGEIERLENELSASQTELRKAQGEARQVKRDLEAAAAERDTFRATAETEGNFARDMVIENGLTAALVENKVASQFMPAAVALLKGQIQVKTGTDGKREAFAGDKPLGEFVKDWATSEAGKHYVAAPANGGGGAGGTGSSGGSAKKISEMTEIERVAHHTAIGEEAFKAQIAAEKKPA